MSADSLHRADDFRGDDTRLIASIDALLDLDDAKALVPHGLGGRGAHAYRLLCAARHRLAFRDAARPETARSAVGRDALIDLIRYHMDSGDYPVSQWEQDFADDILQLLRPETDPAQSVGEGVPGVNCPNCGHRLPASYSGPCVNCGAADDDGSPSAIPAGMKPWHGGDSAPKDWDGGPVLWTNGVMAKPSWYRSWRADVNCGLVTIIAYTPKAAPAQPKPQD